MSKLLTAAAVIAPIATFFVGESIAIGVCAGADVTPGAPVNTECAAVQSRAAAASLGVALVSAGVLFWAHQAQAGQKGSIRRTIRG